MGGSQVHTVEAWHPDHASSSWAQAPPTERDQYAGSSVDPGYRPLSSMSWHHKTGEIRGVYTDPQFQRQGLATRLWSEGQRLAEETRGVTAPKHSADRTNAGDAWARSVGGRLPRKKS